MFSKASTAIEGLSGSVSRAEAFSSAAEAPVRSPAEIEVAMTKVGRDGGAGFLVTSDTP